MIRIQLVDDEPNILNSLRRLLKPQGWQIDTFDKVEDALGALLKHEYAVIVSDYQMPTADGRRRYLPPVRQTKTAKRNPAGA